MIADAESSSTHDILMRLPFPALVIDAEKTPVWSNRRWDDLLKVAGPEIETALQEAIGIALHSARSAPENRKHYTNLPSTISARLENEYGGVFIARMDDAGQTRQTGEHYYISLMDIARPDDAFWRVWETLTAVAAEDRLFSLYYWNLYRHESGRPHFFASDYQPNGGGFTMDCDLEDLPNRFEFVNYELYKEYLLDLVDQQDTTISRIVAHTRSPMGRDRYFETIGHSTPEDERLLASGLAIDVTAMVQARQAQEQAAYLEAARFKQAGIARALNNMLTSCYASVDMLGYETPEDEANPQRIELNRLAADLHRGQKISRSLINLSLASITPPTTIGDNYVAPKPEGATAHSLQRIVDSVQALAHQVTFTSELEVDGFPTLYDVTEERLSGAVINLALNALQAISQKKQASPSASYKGKLHLRFEGHGTRPKDWSSSDEDDPCKHGCLQITVLDDGIGMSPEVKQRCIEPFFSTNTQCGAGVGLSETLAMAMATKGSIRVESEEGAGTKIMIFLPAPEPR